MPAPSVRPAVLSGFSTNGLADPLYIANIAPLANVKNFGAVGDGVTDDTAAIQAAIDAVVVAGLYSGVYLPPGVYRITAKLSVLNISGFRMMGAGSLVDNTNGWYAVNVGSVIKWDGNDTDPMVDFYGTGDFYAGFFALDGDGSNTAAFGFRVREKTNYAGAGGLFQHVSVSGCDVAWNAGDSSDNVANSSDCTYERCTSNRCRLGFQNSHDQAVNHFFYDHTFSEITETCFDLFAHNIVAIGVSAVNVNRITLLRSGGPNSGIPTFRNVKIDGTTYRTIVHECHSSSDGNTSLATYEDVSAIVQQPSHTDDAHARFILRDSATCVLRGGRSLCGDLGSGDTGRLATLSGHSGLTVRETWLPDDPTKVFGTVGADAHYRVRDCWKQDSPFGVYIADY